MRMRNTGVRDYQKKKLGGHVSRRASSTCQSASNSSETKFFRVQLASEIKRIILSITTA